MTSPQIPANENIAPSAANQENEVAAPHAEVTLPAEASKEMLQQDEINRLNEEVSRIKDQWVRAVAEAENTRKRAQRDQEETSRYAVTAFAQDMVNVLENLKRASESIPEAARAENELLKTMGQGVDLTLQELLSIFQKYNINRIDPLDKKFDHNFHQAVVQVERDDVPPGTVVQVVQAGYIIHDRLLRPAMVVVSKNGDPAKKVDTSA